MNPTRDPAADGRNTPAWVLRASAEHLLRANRVQELLFAPKALVPVTGTVAVVSRVIDAMVSRCILPPEFGTERRDTLLAIVAEQVHYEWSEFVDFDFVYDAHGVPVDAVAYLNEWDALLLYRYGPAIAALHQVAQLAHTANVLDRAISAAGGVDQ